MNKYIIRIGSITITIFADSVADAREQFFDNFVQVERVNNNNAS